MSKCAKKCVKIGSLDKRIDILTKTSVANDFGGRSETWSLNSTIWAKLTPKTHSQLNEAGSLEFQETIDIIIRYDSTVFALDRQNIKIRFGLRYMDVKSMINIDEEKRYLSLKCVESKKAEVVVA